MNGAMQQSAVRYPFVISRGAVVMSRSPSAIAAQRVSLCLGTQVGERVMHPLWGIDIMEALFEMEGALNSQTIINAVKRAFIAWFPEYSVDRVEVVKKDSSGPTTMVDVNVTFHVGNSSNMNSAKVGVPVPGGSEMFAGEVFL